MIRISKCDKEARAGFISSDGEVCFSVNFREDDKPIVIDPNGRIVPFKSLVDVDSYGRCKLSIEGQVKSSQVYFITQHQQMYTKFI